MRQTYGYYVDRANEVAQTYYAAVRDTWDAYLNLDLPAYDEMQVDVDMAAYKQFGGLNNTDMPGYTMSQLAKGDNKAGLTFDDLWDKSVTRLSEQDFINLASQFVNHTARMVVERNADSDPSQPRYARVPSGRVTCAFCIMLASRGWEYKSEESAGGGDHRYHPHCDCMIIPSWGKIKLKDYDPDVYYQQYKACAQTVSRLTTKEEYDKYVNTFVPQFAGQKPLKYARWKQNVELAEMRWRDKQWLNTGISSSIRFISKEVEKDKILKNPQEIRTGVRLSKNGVDVVFKKDTKDIYDEKTGRVRPVGLADLMQGIEIKTLSTTASRNTIESHLKSTSKKPDVIRLVIDNSEDDKLSDDELIGFILRTQKCKGKPIYIIGKDEKLVRIK